MVKGADDAVVPVSRKVERETVLRYRRRTYISSRKVIIDVIEREVSQDTRVVPSVIFDVGGFVDRRVSR